MIGPALALLIFNADMNQNGIIDGQDLAAMLVNWGEDGDLNNSGEVDGTDLAVLLSVWRAGWGVNDAGDGRVWFIEPGAALGLEPSPFAGHRRLTFLNESGVIMSIDMLID